MLQQGDVNLTLIPAIPKEARRVNHTTLAEGEVTGHSHQAQGECELLELGERLFLRVLGGDCRVVHEEHNEITVPPGNYEVTPTYEYDYDAEERRQVID